MVKCVTAQDGNERLRKGEQQPKYIGNCSLIKDPTHISFLAAVLEDLLSCASQSMNLLPQLHSQSILFDSLKHPELPRISGFQFPV